MGKASAEEKPEKKKNLGSSPSECQIFHLFRCILSSVLPLRNVGRPNFDKGLHNLTALIQKRHILMRTVVLYIRVDLSYI